MTKRSSLDPLEVAWDFKATNRALVGGNLSFCHVRRTCISDLWIGRSRLSCQWQLFCLCNCLLHVFTCIVFFLVVKSLESVEHSRGITNNSIKIGGDR